MKRKKSRISEMGSLIQNSIALRFYIQEKLENWNNNLMTHGLFYKHAKAIRNAKVKKRINSSKSKIIMTSDISAFETLLS